MKSFKNILSEVAQPKAGDEINFKAKHEIEMYDYPVDVDDQFTSEKGKTKPRRADYAKRDDMKVYEEMDPVDKDAVKKPFKMRKDKDIDNDGDVDSSDRYLHTRRVAVTKAVKKMKEAANITETYAIYYKGSVFDRFNSKAEAEDAMTGMNLSASEKKDYRIRKVSGKPSGMTGKMMKEAAVSKAQQKLMGMALAYKRGEMDDASDEVKELAKSMSEKDLEDYAETKHKGLPKKVNEDAWEEIPMMTRQLQFIEYASEEISEYLNDCDEMCVDPEEWFQNKLAHVHGQMRTLHAYVKGEPRMRMYGEETELSEAKNELVAKYMNKSGDNTLYYEIYEMPNGNYTSTITNQNGVNMSASSIDLKSSHANARKNVDRTTMFYDQDGDKGALKHLNNLLPGWKKASVNEETDLDEAKQPIAYRTFAMGADRVGKRLAQLGADVKRTQDVSKEDIVGEMKSIEKEFDKLSKSATKLPINESLELDEISKKTLGSYVKKANVSAMDHARKSGEYNNPDHLKHFSKAMGRMRGVDKATDKLVTKEQVELDEAFSQGSVKLKDGSTVDISKKDAELLNQMMKDLNAKNRKEMQKVAMKDEAGFEEILGFAREAL